MSLIYASRHAVIRSPSLRNSYLEISNFFRARHPGTTPVCITPCARRTIKAFVRTNEVKDTIYSKGTIDPLLKKTLDEFKSTSTYKK